MKPDVRTLSTADRCGGSTGIGPWRDRTCFPFNPTALRPGTFD